VLSSEEATALLTSMDVSTVVVLRDRAIIAVGAVVALPVEDCFSQKKRWRLQEKNGKLYKMSCRRKLEEYLDAYIRAAGIADDRAGAMFRAAPGKKRLLGPGTMFGERIGVAQRMTGDSNAKPRTFTTGAMMTSAASTKSGFDARHFT